MKNKKIPVTRLIVIFALLWLPRTKATMSLKYACIKFCDVLGGGAIITNICENKRIDD